jgi:aminopeptidase N
MTVGRWQLATLPDPAGTLPMRVYTEASLTDSDRQILEQTGPMLRYFELIFDEPYPWHAYDHVFLPGVTWSMEHTSISFMDADLLGTGTRLQDVVAHELAHHWFGNLVTCRDWSELWLNEGLATYCELLWAEQQARRQRQPTDVPRSRLLTEWRDDVFGEGHLGFPGRMAIANHRYLESDDQFGQADSPYSKGAYIVHMLREHLGDPVFFQALAAYLDEHKHSSVTSEDLRRAFEQASGLSLERFFDQWTRRAGFPVVAATTFVEGDAVNVRLEQTQTIDADNPAYELRVPVVFRSTDGVETTKFVQFAARTAEHTLMLPFSGDDLASVAIDPDRSLLMDLSVLHSPVPAGVFHGTSHSAFHGTSNTDSETH